MPITATTRRCASCGDLLDPRATVCARCDKVHAPPIAEWPANARRLLYLLVIADALATQADAAEQRQLEWLLRSTMAGRTVAGTIIPYAAATAECYVAFAKLCDAWARAGHPTDFASVRQLCQTGHVATDHRRTV